MLFLLFNPLAHFEDIPDRENGCCLLLGPDTNSPSLGQCPESLKKLPRKLERQIPLLRGLQGFQFRESGKKIEDIFSLDKLKDALNSINTKATSLDELTELGNRKIEIK
jgi:hypothetical protein